MPRGNPKIARIVVYGSPSKGHKSNYAKARKMLLQAFQSDAWPSRPVKFAVTPGGFIQAPFPRDYDGERGWRSRVEDFAKLIPYAQQAIDDVFQGEVQERASQRAKFLTLGVDLNDDGGKLKQGEEPLKTHAELVGVVNTLSGKVVHWTGKSHPAGWQQNKLVRVANLESHQFHRDGERVLILGCHDLHLLTNRGQKPETPTNKSKRKNRMKSLVRKFKPSIILQHPHSTDSPNIWSGAWGSAKTLLPRESEGHIYASGIGYYYNRDDGVPRGSFKDVLKKTRCCEDHVLDIVVNGY